MLEFLYKLLFFLFALGILVIVHEAGHFFVALWSGMKVHEFAIGFPPRVVKWVRRGVLYSIGAIPIGGFVRIAGMEPGEEDAKDGFNTKSLSWRFAVLFAGSFMNFVLAAVLFTFIYGAHGQLTVSDKPVIGVVYQHTPAEEARLRVGDRIAAVNGVPMSSIKRIRDTIQKSKGKALRLQVMRRGKPVDLKVTPRPQEYQPGKPTYAIGVQFGEYKRLKLGAALRAGMEETKLWAIRILSFLKQLVRGDKHALENVGGPARIYKEIGEAAQRGLWDYLLIFAIVSVNLGLFNLLPFPALDGGRIFFLFLDRLFQLVGRRIDPKKEALVHVAGFAFLILLILVITAKDIGHFLGGGH